ncbi:MAG: glutathione S-transferase [Parvibaculaceae bacterium]|jgi:glutathione S-transferase
MTDKVNAILFHQYGPSPFSEKIRVIFGIKGLDWYAVEQPVIMPKPELTLLTGGYRKIPVLQIGADVYCDTQRIVAEIEKRYPTPSLFRGPNQGLDWCLNSWADRVFFQAVVAVVFGGGAAMADEAFIADREKLTGRAFDVEAMATALPMMKEQLRSHLGWLNAELQDGRKFLKGDMPGFADAAAFYNIAFMLGAYPAIKDMLATLSNLDKWVGAVHAIGHGNRTEMSREESLAIAHDATSITRPQTDPHEPNGLVPGDAVTIMADDYGQDPIQGELVTSNAHEIAIKRTTDELGDVVIHFPRAGFFVIKS